MSDTNTPIMVAPNGARLTNSDNSGVPVTIHQTIECAVACQKVGAHALHAHVRDSAQKHLLDASAYQALLDMAANKLGEDFPVQITTEAFGLYSIDQQMALVETLKPKFVSIAIREIIRDESGLARAQHFYQWCTEENIGVQHILYGQADLHQFQAHQSQGIIPATNRAVLMVVGRYTDSMVADTTETQSLAIELAATEYHWMLCAFGRTETECLVKAAALGGGTRVGFENNLEHVDGTIANNNAERVSALHSVLGNDLNYEVDSDKLRKMLGG